MSKRIILIEDSNEYERLRSFIVEHGEVYSAVPPHLIECNVDSAELAMASFHRVRILDQPALDRDIRKLPIGIQIAARAYCSPIPETPGKHEGMSWDATGLKPPGRPNAND